MKKGIKIGYWVATGLFSALMLMSAGIYFGKTDEIRTLFEGFGYPSYLVYPLAIAKILGVVALLTRYSQWLKEWAYAVFFFEILLAFFAHYMIGDGEQGGAVMAMVLLIASYVLDGKTKGNLAIPMKKG